MPRMLSAAGHWYGAAFCRFNPPWQLVLRHSPRQHQKHCHTRHIYRKPHRQLTCMWLPLLRDDGQAPHRRGQLQGSPVQNLVDASIKARALQYGAACCLLARLPRLGGLAKHTSLLNGVPRITCDKCYECEYHPRTHLNARLDNPNRR